MAWEPLRIVREEIRVKGASAADGGVEVQPPRPDLLRGQDAPPRVRAAIRAARAWHGAVSRGPATESDEELPRVSRCRDCIWNTPSENLICGDVDGNIAWQRVGADTEPHGRGRRAGAAGCPCQGPASTSGRASGRICRASSTRRRASSSPRTTIFSRRTTRRR